MVTVPPGSRDHSDQTRSPTGGTPYRGPEPTGPYCLRPSGRVWEVVLPAASKGRLPVPIEWA